MTICLIALFSLATYAQENTNRMLVHESSGMLKGFLAERVDSITFAQITGRVAAEIKVLDVTLEKLIVNITRSEACLNFKLVCIPTIVAEKLGNDMNTAAYVDQQTTNVYNQDFTRGELTGVELQANSNYTLITVGQDMYGIPCSVSKADFTTPKIPLIGDPKVTTTIDDVQARDFTASFVPNEDVSGYAAVAGKKGEMLQQYEQWGPMMGFRNFGDLVKAWGVNKTGSSSFTWEDMEPGEEYQIFVQAWDKADTYADTDTLLLTTKDLGGPGEALVDIEPGEYKMMNWDGEQKPSQFITYTPNDQASCYRMGVYLASEYDKNPADFESDIKMDPPMPIVDWFQYEPLTTDYQINPNMDVVAIAAAKNANKEWGSLTVVRFTTPATVDGARVMKSASKETAVRQRPIHTYRFNTETGKASQFPYAKKGVKLIER